MSYNANIPAATDVMSDSQSGIQGNFQALTPFGNGYADFPVQGAAPTFPGGDTGLYTLSYATTSANEMYIVKQSVDAPTNVPFTASKMSNTVIASCASGWSYLPSGILMKWGNAQITADGTNTINVASISGGPSFNQVFTGYLTEAQSGVTVPTFTCILSAFPAATTGNLTVIASGSTLTTTAVSYMVLGV